MLYALYIFDGSIEGYSSRLKTCNQPTTSFQRFSVSRILSTRPGNIKVSPTWWFAIGAVSESSRTSIFGWLQLNIHISVAMRIYNLLWQKRGRHCGAEFLQVASSSSTGHPHPLCPSIAQFFKVWPTLHPGNTQCQSKREHRACQVLVPSCFETLWL